MGEPKHRVHVYSALEAARLCGVVNQTAINWIKSGHLKAFTTPGGQFRIYAEDLLSFLEERGMRVPAELQEEVESPLDRSLVLVVDDDRDLNDILKRMLERKIPDISVRQAFDGFEAGRVVAESRPALILLDVDLPGIDGKKLCARIHDDPSLGNPAIIAMTGLDMPDIKVDMLAAGASDFFPKPLDFPSVIAATERHVGRSKGRSV